MNEHSSSSLTGKPILFPESVIPSKYSNQVIVTDVLISRGTSFGPFPGNDASEKKFNNWMQYVTSVRDYCEANLIVAFFKEQLYFHCNKNIPAGTELVVWAGQKKRHLKDSSEWAKYKIDKTNLTFLCQECDFNTESSRVLVTHNNSSHLAEYFPLQSCKCPHCPHIVCARKNLHVHLLQHGINLLIDQKKATIEIESSASDSHSKSRSQSDSTTRDKAIPTKSAYNCKLCKKTFNRLRQLSGHMVAAHQRKKSTFSKIVPIQKLDSNGVDNARRCSVASAMDQEFVCSVCKNSYLWKHNLIRHMKKTHDLQ